MTIYRQHLAGTTYQFDGMVDLLAKATPLRSGDELSGCAASPMPNAPPRSGRWPISRWTTSSNSRWCPTTPMRSPG